ncbi:glycine cleavage system aminomethyltransferase GcvT [uncultured Roseivirga sp.]|uniref:glycine cleavage system aminomethyltransferase GcvT n=1 Tax=uncultured Roseivirga sp. TaxID=543088 RepID=UPI000D791610|nr:glycine cleavage system aminomethyltransferase GcvT [uncultured Roseivirga sp.]PWL29333.1 MAG: glycine cleavage system aminomethyltransferase GcvT [Roseivirga sp. XM-24bin3]
MELKKVALNDLHESLGAKMVPFAGYNMPVRYSSDIEEHNTVRNGVGVFDVSHMGEFVLEGPDALDLIQRVTSNDASKLVDGQAQYSYLPNKNGGIVDDLLVYRFNETKYMLVVNASNIEKDWNWISQFNTKGVNMKNVSDDYSLFAVQGPKAVESLQKLTSVDLSEIKFYNFVVGPMAGVDHVIISATGYTGAGGFEIYVHNDHAETVWKQIFEAGTEFDIKPIGLGARDTLRLEMGYCLYGNDITDETSPIAAGLGWVTKFTKEFTNSEGIKKDKEEGVDTKLVAFKMIDKGIPRSHYELMDAEENVIGEVTSGSQSPTLGVGIGLGYVKKEFAKAGTEIMVAVRNRRLKAEVVKLPFVQK